MKVFIASAANLELEEKYLELCKNNKFKNSAYAGGCAIVINPHVLEGDTPYHRNIIIEDNEDNMSSDGGDYGSV